MQKDNNIGWLWNIVSVVYDHFLQPFVKKNKSEVNWFQKNGASVKCWTGVRLCLHEVHYILPFAVWKHAFDPQYFCSPGTCIWGADVFLAFSKAYSVTNTIEITSKISDNTDKMIRDAFEPDLRFPDLKETSFSSSNGSILKGFNRVAINKNNVIWELWWFSRFVFLMSLFAIDSLVRPEWKTCVTQHNTLHFRGFI